MTLLERLRQFGRQQKRMNILPMVALTLAEAAKCGEIDADDAQELYLEYYKNSTGIKKPDVGSSSFRVNTSKLRQIIKAKDPALLRRVIKIHAQVSHERPTRQLYGLMVLVCRKKLNTGRAPPDEEIKKLAQRPPA